MDKLITSLHHSLNSNLTITSKFSPILRQIQKKDVILQKYTFKDNDGIKEEMSKKIIGLAKGKTTFDDISLYGIALLIPLLDTEKAAIGFTDVEFAFFLFWYMCSQLFAYKDRSTVPNSFDYPNILNVPNPITKLLNTYSQDPYLIYFPEYFEEATGISMVRENMIRMDSVYNFVVDLNISSIMNGYLLLKDDNYYDTNGRKIAVSFIPSSERSIITFYAIENNRAIGTSI